MYLGNYYKLCISAAGSAGLCFDNEFLLPQGLLDKAKEVFIKWYKDRAKEIIKERVDLYSEGIDSAYSKIRITNANSRWGSCSVKGNLNFSWRIIMAPLEILDYVVVHEMVHLLEKNHSKRFWDKVGTYFPDYKKCRKWLKEEGFSLAI